MVQAKGRFLKKDRRTGVIKFKSQAISHVDIPTELCSEEKQQTDLHVRL